MDILRNRLLTHICIFLFTFLLLMLSGSVIGGVITSRVNNESVVSEACDGNHSENHFIYCSGRLLEAVNHHELYGDSKQFVDKPLKRHPSIVAAEFDKQFPGNIKQINKTELQNFVNANFRNEGEELLPCALDDWHEEPAQLKRIKDQTLRKWALDLNLIWKNLCRKMDDDIENNTALYSLIYVPKPFIVPGGRFREFYYWDAYWIIKGLIASGLVETTRHMLDNFFHIVDKYGFIPNGGRVYYLRRSQPPLLAAMVYEYYEASRDDAFLIKALPRLEKEIEFWDQHRNITVQYKKVEYKFYQYRAESNVPRPESFREDINHTKQYTKIEDKRRIYRDIASAAESGWDFSTRWLTGSGLDTIQTTSIVPVDLNSYMCWNFKLLNHLYRVVGNTPRSIFYGHRYRIFMKKFQEFFYVHKAGGWYDYNMRDKAHNFEFFPSIAIPLFTGCYDDLDLEQSARIFDKMETMGVFDHAGGIPTSLKNGSSQQWDHPNGWSPLNHMVIEGLRQSKNSRMQQKAFWLAEKWVLSNYRVYLERKRMYEKYNVIEMAPEAGSGGEYEVQEGFGWTNGVVLDLLKTYSDRMTFNELAENPSKVANFVITNPDHAKYDIVSANDPSLKTDTIQVIDEPLPLVHPDKISNSATVAMTSKYPIMLQTLTFSLVIYFIKHYVFVSAL